MKRKVSKPRVSSSTFADRPAPYTGPAYPGFPVYHAPTPVIPESFHTNRLFPTANNNFALDPAHHVTDLLDRSPTFRRTVAKKLTGTKKPKHYLPDFLVIDRRTFQMLTNLTDASRILTEHYRNLKWRYLSHRFGSSASLSHFKTNDVNMLRCPHCHSGLLAEPEVALVPATIKS